MSYNNAKVNPFYIQDGEDWDDDEEYDDYDYDDEQVMLMSGSAGIKNRKYNNDSRSLDMPSNRQQQQHSQHYNRSYHNGQYERHSSHNQHRPQLWKYVFLLVTIIGVIVFGASSSSSEKKGEDYNVSLSSLVDEIPNNDISNNEYRIVVLGERHSGTAWMRERLRECFPHVEVSNHLQRMGYFFQDDEATARSKAEHSESLANIHDTTTIVVHVTLNIYDWLEQMRLSPEYAPDHAGKHQQLDHQFVPLGWNEFLSKPWTTERPDSDLDLVNQTGPVCQMGFEYDEVVSCSQSAKGIGDPMYELYENGKPFESIIDLRTAKLKNHHGVLESWPSVQKMIQISYENTAQEFKGKLLHEILEFTGWKDVPCSGDIPPPSLDSSKDMTVEFVEYVSERADWDTEQSVASYSKWTEQEISSKNIRSEPEGSTPSDSTEESSEKQSETTGEKESDSGSQIAEKDTKTTNDEDESSEAKKDSSAIDSSSGKEPTDEIDVVEEIADETPKETEELPKTNTENSLDEKEEQDPSSAKDESSTSTGDISEEASDISTEKEENKETDAQQENANADENEEEATVGDEKSNGEEIMMDDKENSEKDESTEDNLGSETDKNESGEIGAADEVNTNENDDKE